MALWCMIRGSWSYLWALGCASGYYKTANHFFLKLWEQNMRFDSTLLHMYLDAFYVPCDPTSVLMQCSWPWKKAPVLLLPTHSCIVSRAGPSRPLGTLWNVTESHTQGSHRTVLPFCQILMCDNYDLGQCQTRSWGGKMKEDRDAQVLCSWAGVSSQGVLKSGFSHTCLGSLLGSRAVQSWKLEWSRTLWSLWVSGSHHLRKERMFWGFCHP